MKKEKLSQEVDHWYEMYNQADKESYRTVQKLDQLELLEAKARMALEEANERIEQLEENLHAIHECASEYAAFNTVMEKVQKMAKEGLDERA